MTTIKIIHLADSLSGGGAEGVFRQTVQALQQNHDKSYLNLVACGHNDTSINANLTLKKYAGTSVKEKLNQVYSLYNYRKLTAFLFKERPLIIHLQNYGNLSCSVLHAIHNYKTKFPGIRVIQTLHTFELACSHFAAFDYKKNVRCLDCKDNKFRFRIFYRNCSRGGLLHSWGKGISSLISDYFTNRGVVDHWIVPSIFMQGVIANRIKNLNLSTLIPNPVQDDIIQVGEIVKAQENTVVYFGRFSEEKNLLTFINALDIYKKKYFSVIPIKVKLIGKGEEEVNIINKIKQDKIEFIQILPFMNSADLQKEISKSKVSVLPSKCYENFPLFIIESVANQVIPIVSNHGGMKEIAEWLNVGEMFSSDNPEQMAEVLFKVFSEIDKHTTRMALAKKISEELGASQYANKVIQVYRKILFNVNNEFQPKQNIFKV